METTFPTVTGIISKVREIAAREPNRKYEELSRPWSGGGSSRCYYVHGLGDEKAPGCLFGHALAELGVSLEALSLIDAGADVSVPGNAIGPILQAYAPDWERDQPAVQWCQWVQRMQDTGAYWGQAVERANEDWPDV